MTGTRRVASEPRGLSPVVGAALLVAITVVLAAGAGTFLFGIGGPSEPGPSVAVTFEDGEIGGVDYVEMTVVSIERADSIEIRCDAAVTSFTDINPAGSAGPNDPPGDEPHVGRTVGCGTGATTMTVRATYDGKTEVVAQHP